MLRFVLFLQVQGLGTAPSDEGDLDIEGQQGNGLIKQEDSRWDLACQVCGEEGNLLGCDVGLFKTR